MAQLLHSAWGDFALNSSSTSGAIDRIGWFPWAVTFAAVLIRARAYLANGALWLDEAYLGLNLIHRDYSGLVGRLEYDQGAPLGFLYLSRAAIVAFGDSEYVLRLVPFLASVAAPVMFLLLARRMLSGGALNVALILFAVSLPLTRYATECKPYAVDLLVALVLTLLVFRYAERASLSNTLALTAAGVVSVAFSFTAIFVLAGGGVALLLGQRGRGVGALSRTCCVGAAWVIGFGLYYWFNVRHLTGNADVVSWHNASYMPLPPKSADNVYWFLQSAVAAFEFPVGLSLPGIGLTLAVLGVAALLDRSRLAVPLLILPLGAALLASGMRLYPFTQRFLLFAAPALMILVGAGFGFVRDHSRGRAIAWGCLFFLLIHPVMRTAHAFVDPQPAQGLRPIMARLAEQRQPEDWVYVYHWAHPTFRYYAPRYGIAEDRVVTDVSSRRDWGYYLKGIEPLREHDRVWFVFEHAADALSAGEEQFFVTHLDRIGTQQDRVASRTASAYLYDLSGTQGGDGIR